MLAVYFTRMSFTNFEDLNMVAPKISKSFTQFRMAVSAQDGLLVKIHIQAYNTCLEYQNKQ